MAKVYIDRSIDRGVSFGSDVIVYDSLNDYIPPWLPYTVNLAISKEGKIYVAWIAYNSDSYSDCDVYFTTSTDGGLTFDSPIILNSMGEGDILAHPWIAIESDNVLYVAYTQRTSTVANVYLVKSQDGGISFGIPVKVTDGSTQRYCGGAQVVVASDGKIHIVWTDNRAGEGTQYLDIYYSTSLDGGISFNANIRVNDDLEVTPPDTHPHFTRGAQGTPTIITDSESIVHIVWEDFRNFVDDTTYCRDLYYAFSENLTQFSSNIKANYVHPEAYSVNCADPNIAIDSQDNFYIVYSDAPSGDNDHPQVFFVYVSKEVVQPTNTSSTINGFQLFPILLACLIGVFSKKKKHK